MTDEVVLQSNADAQAKSSNADHKFVRDLFFSNLPIPFQKLCSYLLLVVFARKLGTNGYGAWSLLMVSLVIAGSIATLNVGSAMMRFLNGHRTSEQIDRSIST